MSSLELASPNLFTRAEAAELVAKEAKSRPVRLPSQAELLAALPEGSSQFTFGYAKAVWTADGGVVDPESDDVVRAAAAEAEGDAAKAAVVFVVGPRQRPPPPKRRKLRVLGYTDKASFQQCREAAAYLSKEYSEQYAISVFEMLGYQFERKRDGYLAKCPDVERSDVIIVDEEAGTAEDGDAFVRHACETTGFQLFNVEPADPQSYLSLAQAGHRRFLRTTGSTFSWMQIKVDDMLQGKIVFQLFSNVCPKTCQNFVHLCRGDLPDATDEAGKPVKLHYKGSSIFRIVKDGWIQGGDIHGAKSGNGGWSIYGRHFPDESFNVPHDDQGILGMANDGEHTNSSSFYITAGKSAWMDKRYVAFGRVVEGMAIVRYLLGLDTKHNQTPVKKVVIDDCGYTSLDN